MAKRIVSPKERTISELLAEMNTKGIEFKIPGSERIVRIRNLDAPTLLREGKMPDILTPLVIRSIYQEISDKEIREFLGQNKNTVNDALALLETMDFVAERVIMDGTRVAELTLGEKRWLFRVAMEPAELLVSFRYDPNDDVADVDESHEVQQTSQ